MSRPLVIGTRGSALALWQAHAVQDALAEAIPSLATRIRVISTKGDRILDKPLEQIGDKGLFTKELEAALLTGEVDVCVHSMKDMPSELPEGCEICAMLPRADARDALVCGPRIADATGLREVPAGARLGTGSMRRTAQLRAFFPQVQPTPIRGNVDTRLAKSQGADYEGAILAAAGLKRMGADAHIAAFIPPSQIVPAVGQGAIGMEIRSEDAAARAACAAVNDAATFACVTAERSVLAALEGGCQAPIGVHARWEDGELRFDAIVLAPDGSRHVRVERRCPAETDPRDVAPSLVEELVSRGALEVLAGGQGQQGASPAGPLSGQAGAGGANAALETAPSPVKVYLVGAGPGDPGLLTVRGQQLLAAADIVVYDYLASAELVGRTKPGAECIYVGKKGFSAHVSQDQINGLLVQKARELECRGGGTLVRLKGGDPFVFGRGGEEALALADAGIAYQVVPGVTSGIAAPAYAGIPVTHRGLSSSVTFITGHEDPTKNASAIDWTGLARMAETGGTLCFYMGMRNLGLISGRLVGEGVPRETPVALVRWGTTNAQQVLVATLQDVDERAREAAFGAPAIILVGPVAALRDRLAWFEDRPLFGRTVVVTRSRSQASAFSARLTELGAAVLEVPTIEFAEPDDFGPLDAALGRLGDYDWVVFTSVNGVDAFFERLAGCAAAFPDARALAGVRVAAIGPATAERLASHGIRADVLPKEYRGEAVFTAIASASAGFGAGIERARVLIPRAQVAREALPSLLRSAGAHVDVVAAYKTVPPTAQAVDALVAQLKAGEVDAVTFTSSSTARNLVEMLGDHAGLLRGTRLFSIGPVTSKTLADKGFSGASEAREYTIDGLTEALVEAFA